MTEIYSKVSTVVLAPKKKGIRFVHIIFVFSFIAFILGALFFVKSFFLSPAIKEVDEARFIYGFVDDFGSVENSKARWDFSQSVNERAYLLNGESLELKNGGVAKWPSRISGSFEAFMTLTPVAMSVLNSSFNFSFSEDFGIEVKKLESGDFGISAFETEDGIKKELTNRILPGGNSFLLKIVKIGGGVTFYIDDVPFAVGSSEYADIGNVELQAYGEKGGSIRIFADDFYLRFNKSI